MRGYLAAVLLMLIIFTGCTGVNVISIKSLENDIDRYKGREISYKRGSFVDTEIEVDEVKNGRIYFFVYMRNNSEEKLEVMPENFSLKAYLNKKDLDDEKGKVYWAYDPEKVIQDIEKEYEETQNSRSLASGLNCCFSLFSFAARATSDEYTVSEAAGNTTAEYAERSDLIEDEYGRKMDKLNSDKEFWRKEVLRSTVLNPKEEIGGLVVFYLPENVSYLRIQFPFEKAKHSYLFELKGRN